MKIVDNFLSKEEHDIVVNKLSGIDAMFPWYLCNHITFATDKHPSLYYFIHNFYKHDNMWSDEFNWIKKIILSKIDTKSLIRIKANLYPRQKSKSEHQMHSDFDFTHKGALYYVNTNDGHTIFEDGTRVESVANRMIFFDPSIKHCSTDCTDEKYRININFNYF
tara:strand:- start:83 stop:574 length:492 start_codon:yes stop_codon:yes gene_type:complete